MQTQRTRRTAGAFGWLLLLGLITVATLSQGCASTGKAPRSSIQRELATAEALFKENNYAQAMMACVDIAKRRPDLPGLTDLQRRIMTKLAEIREEKAKKLSTISHRTAIADANERRILPGTYGLTRLVHGETGSLKSIKSAMELVLRKPVTVNLENVGLGAFIMAIGKSDNINIVADGALAPSTAGSDDEAGGPGGGGGGGGDAGGKTLTIHADKVPLIEILDYVSRNLGVTFYVGENLIWATASAQAETGAPLETRIYKLRKGLAGDELEDADEIDIVKLAKQVLPAASNSQLVFNKKTHTLIARNTRDNLTQLEALIEALDVNPPQVLIEARFISTSVNDLRELGIDWILQGPVGVSTKEVVENGRIVRRNKTQIAPDPASSLKFQGFENQAMGLNLTYQGLLTDPMFQATLHAIQTSGKGRTLSVPRVTALNNREAKIRIGEDFRYFEQYDLRSVNTNERDSNNNPITRTELVPVGTPTLQELGIELTVTPSVGADRRSITLKTTPKITSFERFEYYTASSSSSGSQTNGTGMLKLPVFKTSEVDTEVIAQSGDTVVMGGLISSTEGKTVNGIPILSSIPLIGRLFQSEGVNETKANLLIFVTATILSDRGENLIPEDEPAGEVGSQATADETTVETTDEAASDQANDENK